jgi:hypothetical protein
MSAKHDAYGLRATLNAIVEANNGGDPNGLRAVIENILDVANGDLQSGLVSVAELEGLRRSLRAFEISAAAILKDLPDQSKLNLVSIINSVFTIGSTCGLSITTVKNITRYNKRRQAAKARKARAEKPRQELIDNAINAALKGRAVTSRFSKEAAAILNDVNRLLGDCGQEPIKVDVIRHRLENRAGKKPQS